MHKIFQLEERFSTGEPTIQLVLTGNGRGGRILEKRAFDSASSSPAYEFLKSVTPKDGHSIVLVNALGAYETYDDNRNGDSFPNRPIKVGSSASCGHPGCNGSAWIAEDETLSKHYKSFEAHGGIYKHHVNKDPSKSLGKVLKALWNDKMQRVELLLEIVNARDTDLAKKIGDGEYPAVSMGCHVKWDVCNICGHRAPTRKDYCEHARNKMRQVLPNGEKVCVHNPSPRFFDISFVYRPADPTGFMLKKVASEYEVWSGYSAKAGELVDQYEQKIADAKKLGDIRKQLLGQVAASRQDKTLAKYRATAIANARGRKPAEQKDIAKLSQYPLSTIASTFAAKNAALSSGDISRLFLKRAGIDAPEWLIDRVVAVQPVVESVFARDPSLREKVSSLLEVSDRHVDPSLFPVVDAWVEKYAGLSDFVEQRAHGPIEPLSDMPVGPGALYRASEPPRTDVLTITDPSTGHMYQTTRGAAEKAHNQNIKQKLFGAAILTAAYGGALHHGIKHVFHPRVSSKVPWWALLPAAGYGAYKTVNLGDQVGSAIGLRNPVYITDQGIAVPGNTEFAKVGALTEPTYLDKVAFDIIERAGTTVDPMSRLLYKVASKDPSSLISRLLTSDYSDSEKAAYLCSNIEDDSDPLRPPVVDLDALSDRVGSLLLS